MTDKNYYIPQHFKDGQVLEAKQLNHIEESLAKAVKEVHRYYTQSSPSNTIYWDGESGLVGSPEDDDKIYKVSDIAINKNLLEQGGKITFYMEDEAVSFDLLSEETVIEEEVRDGVTIIGVSFKDVNPFILYSLPFDPPGLPLTKGTYIVYPLIPFMLTINALGGIPEKPTSFPPPISEFFWHRTPYNATSEYFLYKLSDTLPEVKLTNSLDNIIVCGTITFSDMTTNEIEILDMIAIQGDGEAGVITILFLYHDENGINISPIPLGLIIDASLLENSDDFGFPPEITSGFYLYDLLGAMEVLEYQIFFDFNFSPTSWSEEEPQLKEDKYLYSTLCTVYNDGTFSYSNVFKTQVSEAISAIKQLEKQISKLPGVSKQKSLTINGTVYDGSEAISIDMTPFVITITADENDVYTADKTGEEILTAYEEGRQLICAMRNTKISLTRHSKLFNYQSSFSFLNSTGTNYSYVVITLSSSTKEIKQISVSDGTYATNKDGVLLINGQPYDGSEFLIIDTREFVFNVTMDEETGKCEIDVTAEEFLSAYNSGRTMACVFNGVRLPMFTFIAEDGWFQFLAKVGAYGFECDISARDNEIRAEGYIGDASLIIGGEVWGGTELVDFTDTINQMIDDKIPEVKDGTSVTVKSVSESTIDGGSNVVTFSDGKTVTIKNGSKGSKGEKGDKGDSFKASVTEYGAKGDGTTDDTSAFQDALSKERVVFVHGGTYILNDTLVIRENCCLELSQDTILKFANTSGNCIEMRGSAVLRGNHGNIDVSNNFTGNVISVDTGLDGVVHGNIPPYASGTPLWKRQRFIYDVNITRTHKGHQGSYDGSHSGTALYISANFETKESYNGSTTAPISCIWAMTVSGLRIGGAFDYGINIQNRDRTESGYGNEGDPAWNHDMRIEAVIVGCETGVRVFNCNTAHLAVTIEPGLSIVDVDGAKVKYAKNGIVLEHSHNIDLSQSLVWDWDTNATLVNKDEKNKHIALIGDCRGTILSDHYYHESPEDIRSLIYTDTPSNFDNLIILQEPFTRWFKPIDGKPYFFDGSSHKELTTQEEFKSLFDTTMVAKFTNQLPISTDNDGTVYNGTGYKVGVSMAGYLPPTISNDGYGLLTGLIPVSKGATIRFSDLWWNVKNEAQRYYERIFFFKEDKTAIPNGSNYALFLSSNDIESTKNNNLISNYQESENGTSFTLGSNTQLNDVAYIRVNFYRGNIGAKPTITVNEEIKYEQVGVLSDGVKIKAENVVGLPNGSGVTLQSPNGTLYKIVVNDDGTLSTTQ